MSEAEAAISMDDDSTAAARLVDVAAVIFSLDSFAPESAPAGWPNVLRHWVYGRPLGELIGDRIQIAQFIESDLIYRLVWGVEAARVYEAAQGNLVADTLLGTAVTAIETGTFNRAASVLIRAGFDHRLAAISVVTQQDGDFDSLDGMREWIDGLDPALTFDRDWPSRESWSAWQAFVNQTRSSRQRRWTRTTTTIDHVQWQGPPPDPRAWLRVTDFGPDKIQIWSPGFELLGEAAFALNPSREGVLRARRSSRNAGIQLQYRGPNDLLVGAD